MEHKQEIDLFELEGKRIDVCSDRISMLRQFVALQDSRIDEIEENINEGLHSTQTTAGIYHDRFKKLEEKVNLIEEILTQREKDHLHYIVLLYQKAETRHALYNIELPPGKTCWGECFWYDEDPDDYYLLYHVEDDKSGHTIGLKEHVLEEIK